MLRSGSSTEVINAGRLKSFEGREKSNNTIVLDKAYGGIKIIFTDWYTRNNVV